MRTITNRYRLICTMISNRAQQARLDERGEINSSIAWTGAMVLLAVTIAGIVAAKANGFAEGIDFGG